MVFKNILWIMIESLWAHAAINHPAKHSVQYSNIDYFSNLILSIPKWIQLIEPNWLKNRKSLEREPWINILKVASQMEQNFIKVKKFFHKRFLKIRLVSIKMDFWKNLSQNIKIHHQVMKKSWKVVNHHFKVSLLFARAKQAMKH